MEDRPIRVLLIEDDPGDARLVHEMLRGMVPQQFEVIDATCLADGLQRLNEGRFDAVLLDLLLPDSQGVDTFLKTHERAGELPIVVLTGLADRALAAQAVSEGAQDYLVKGQVTGDRIARSVLYARERQRATRYEALLLERQRFDVAVSQMSDGIVVVDSVWRISRANRAAYSLLGIPGDAWRGVSLADVLRRFQISKPWAELSASADRVTSFAISRLHPEPVQFYDARLTRLLDPDGSPAGGVLMVRDVTAERYRDRLRAEFLALVPLKLRAPLTLLDACLHLWKERSSGTALEERRRLLELCEQQISCLKQGLAEVLQFETAEAAERQAKVMPIDLHALVADVCASVRQRYPAKQAEIRTHIDPEANHTNAITDLVAFVLDQVLDNSLRFGDKVPVQVSVSVDREETAGLSVSVEDNGPGIPRECQDRLFEGGLQMGLPGTGQVPGLGVGLFLARRIVQAYGGSISVKSRMGKGCTVEFALPDQDGLGA